MIDGAKNALFGYLYQLIGTVQVAILTRSEEDDGEVMLRVDLGPGRFMSEEVGQDLVFHPIEGSQQGVTLIQYKHSFDANSSIDREDFLKILHSFDRSKDEAEKDGGEVARYIVVTNRGTASGVDEIYSHRNSDVYHPSLDVRSGGSKEVPKGKLHLLKAYGGDPEAAARAWHRIVQRLDVHSGQSFQGGYDCLKLFGSRHGILDREWNASVNRLYGAYFKETAEGRSIEVTIEWLKSHLIGDPDAANLDYRDKGKPHIATRCKDRIVAHRRGSHRVPDVACLDRELYRRIEEQLRLRTVVFVTGRGGRGKSLAVSRCLESMAEQRVVVSLGAHEAKELAVVEVFSEIRLPSLGGEVSDRTVKQIFERLKKANGGSRNLLLIDLDGLDEAPERTHELVSIIKLCWAHGRVEDSPASVVATCRTDMSSDGRVRIMSKWLRCEPDMVEDRVGFVELGDFGDHELYEVARLLGGEPEQRILNQVRPSWRGGPLAVHEVAPHVWQSLHTPFVWGAYAALAEGRRGRILDGDKDELSVLARTLGDRFFGRCWSRKRWANESIVEQALFGVAASFSDQALYSETQWEKACSEQGLGMSESRELYNECLTFGVIDSQAKGQWRWAHEFLTKHFAARFGLEGEGA